MGRGKPGYLSELTESAGPEAGMTHSAWDSRESSVTHGQVHTSKSFFSRFSHFMHSVSWESCHVALGTSRSPIPVAPWNPNMSPRPWTGLVGGHAGTSWTGCAQRFSQWLCYFSTTQPSGGFLSAPSFPKQETSTVLALTSMLNENDISSPQHAFT